MSLFNYSYLNNFLSPESFDYVSTFLIENKVDFKITRERFTKFGDYRFFRNGVHKITINGNLNTNEFLLVTLHEIAHMLVQIRMKKRVKPHGIEWKSTFAELILRTLELNGFSPELEKELNNYILKGFTPSSKVLLYKKLRNDSIDVVYLEDIPINSTFSVKNNRTFVKLEKLRKRFKCQDTKNKRMYLVHPQTIVIDYKPAM